ncbi:MULTISPECIES: oligopeptide/dipeptide ABC transporter ATP-binding protein [unclassified Paenibacillus]|uniref:ABC transporter ATP-binding protein n=1 Tax=unclassified Paenibacillus TaxID=185978 RepID=UPI00240581B7|nr:MULTISPECIES: oligopeptide/dipeptide ABC transporter ATP-binding protein [unclassified Paenibacillus]MDF9843226.1 oligopeptide transport system ATP-binding protein [Paenibacillus sp. PastF-2]MDF9849814.1 oligopeptide transport system ATP-binding protein [Paenibacillus sp. PastM-2]MDF9856521.1 oligopeptide transport system ATP-binding protein [Paenibacillus sp. PastF-1]MDH6481791.1 oligopeptide transport system ATP-binding protein [Paenibacillus sp. PastH-2]MDH6509119.1 oligopeptide transpor
MSKNLIEVEGLKKYFNVGKGKVLKAVDNINFSIREGETLGMVGESGCGKTTAGRTVLRLYEPTAGSVKYNGTDIYKLSPGKMKAMRRDMQMIFQDPYASLNPRFTISDIIGEALDIHGMGGSRAERKKRIEELLDMVGLNHDHATRYPHEFSGGQRQRIGIARALAVNPKFIVCDEPISALDVSIQAQVVNLLKELQDRLGLTYLFIAHDLSMVKHISDRVAVMYLGRMVELAESEELYANPLHPYTKSLLSAIPEPDPEVEANKKRIQLHGELGSPIYAAGEKSNDSDFELVEVSKGHFVAKGFA